MAFGSSTFDILVVCRSFTFCTSVNCNRNSSDDIVGLRYHFDIVIRNDGSTLGLSEVQVMLLSSASRVPSCIGDGDSGVHQVRQPSLCASFLVNYVAVFN